MKVRIMALMIVTALLLFSGCELVQMEENSTSETANVKVYLTDRPLKELEHLYVDIESVAYHYDLGDEGTTVVLENSTTVDLLSLAGTEVELFDIENVPEDATLVWIGLEISDATVVVDGVEHPVSVDRSNAQREEGRDYFKIIISESVSDGDSIVIDFDVSRSVIYKPGRDEYILKPVLGHMYRHHNAEDHHTIYGEVLKGGEPLYHALVALYTSDESTIVRTTLTNSDGEFKIRCVEDGEYVLAIFEDYDLEGNIDINNAATKLNVTVSGEDVDLGEIEL